MCGRSIAHAGGERAGGIWIVEADTDKEADALVRNDPLWPTGLRKSYQVLAWTRVFAHGRSLIGLDDFNRPDEA